VDLFDPPQREEFRQRILELKAQGLTERKIAAALGITQPVVQRAAALSRKMAQGGLSDPYLPLFEPPEDYTKWRRHRHDRFEFVPKAVTLPDPLAS
jgi:hypothetical protein